MVYYLGMYNSLRVFDAVQAVKTLRESGFTDEQAQGIVHVLLEMDKEEAEQSGISAITSDIATEGKSAPQVGDAATSEESAQ